MIKKKASHPLTEAEGFALMKDYFQSGMGASEFYKSRNLSEWHFYKWRRAYLKANPQAAGEKTTANPPSPFQPVIVTDLPSDSSLPGLEIHYPGGVVLRIEEGLDDISRLIPLLKL